MSLLEMTIPGDPVPKARPRLGPHGTTYTPPRTRKAEDAITAVVRQRWGARPLVMEPVGLAVEFYCATKRRTDGDNLLKLVTDALNKVVFDDDSLILEWFCRVHRGIGKENARTEIFLYLL